MVDLKYNIQITDETFINNMKRIINQIYKLLPGREEGVDWKLPLLTIMEELSGLYRLLNIDNDLKIEEDFLLLLSKLEGLFSLEKEEDFFVYRRTIFECLRLANDLMEIE